MTTSGLCGRRVGESQCMCLLDRGHEGGCRCGHMSAGTALQLHVEPHVPCEPSEFDPARFPVRDPHAQSGPDRAFLAIAVTIFITVLVMVGLALWAHAAGP